MWNRNDQTICAVSTPHGSGGISVIRVSGPEALSSVQNISSSLKKKKNIKTHTAHFVEIQDFEKNKIDEAVVLYFEKGRSFTGEEVVEISCHGSPNITKQILDVLVMSGCKLAEKGEFTFRAFMNGRLDLVQAEAVLALIESKSKASSQIALRQLEGRVSNQFEEIISDLTWCLAHIEASIDFIEQGVDVVDPRELIKKLNTILAELKKLINSYESGRLVKDGIRVVFAGEPNVGKSSLLNLLLQEDRAIVTPIAGTTRDVIDGETAYEGVRYFLVDTAGLRETKDQIESIGIGKSKKEAERADLICCVLDCSQKEIQKQIQQARQLSGLKKLFVFNKEDLISEKQKNTAAEALLPEEKCVFVSAIQKECRDKLFAAIKTNIGNMDHMSEAVLSSTRQYEQSVYAFEMISKSVLELEKNTGAEFVAMYLKESLLSLQKILGQVYDDQIMDRVFKEFCLGK